MRAAGVARLRLGNGYELELAPYVYDSQNTETNDKAEPDAPGASDRVGLCVIPECPNKSGWSYAPQYCRDHGLQAMGVTGNG